MNYFISDTHFFHNKIIEYSKRPFNNLKQMHETIITNWNKAVGEEDEVYFLGDLAMFGHAKEVEEILQTLNGKKYLIKGNHDNWMFKENNMFVLDQFEEVFPQRHIIEIDGKKIYLQHSIQKTHPTVVPKRCKFYVYGHSHGVYHAVAEDSRFLNVCVETLDYTPRTFYELERYNEKYKRSGLNNNGRDLRVQNNRESRTVL